MQGPATTTQIGKGLDIHSQVDGESDKDIIEAGSVLMLQAPSQDTTGGAEHCKPARGYQQV
jgi:hypothetical protein